METTQKKHWQNGYQVRGGWFHTFNFSLFSFGFMVSWGKKEIKNRLKVFKLI
jgi:hypothetical protein